MDRREAAEKGLCFVLSRDKREEKRETRNRKEAKPKQGVHDDDDDDCDGGGGDDDDEEEEEDRFFCFSPSQLAFNGFRCAMKIARIFLLFI